VFRFLPPPPPNFSVFPSQSPISAVLVVQITPVKYLDRTNPNPRLEYFWNPTTDVADKFGDRSLQAQVPPPQGNVCAPHSTFGRMFGMIEMRRPCAAQLTAQDSLYDCCRCTRQQTVKGKALRQNRCKWQRCNSALLALSIAKEPTASWEFVFVHRCPWLDDVSFITFSARDSPTMNWTECGSQTVTHYSEDDCDLPYYFWEIQEGEPPPLPSRYPYILPSQKLNKSLKHPN
jgi:hypothetical protein